MFTKSGTCKKLNLSTAHSIKDFILLPPDTLAHKFTIRYGFKLDFLKHTITAESSTEAPRCGSFVKL